MCDRPTPYRAAKVHGDVIMPQGAPCARYDDAMQVHADELARTAQPVHLGAAAGGYWRRTVLLDLGALDVSDPDALGEVLMTDPLLAAIYSYGLNLGRLRGKLDEQKRAAAYTENPDEDAD